MLIVKVDNKIPLEKALKNLKSKVIKTKQNEILRARKEFVKKSVSKRMTKQKAMFKQKFKDFH
jgi:ribosomal protein S21